MGESEANIRDLFSKANKTAPSIVFIDEIDAIASKRENMHSYMEKRIVIQLMTCIDESQSPVVQEEDADENSDSQTSSYVLVIRATNRPDALDPALRRPGRFDREIFLGVPDENSRLEILSVVMRRQRLEGSFDLLKIARGPGYVGADLAQLAKRAGIIAMNRILDKWYSTKQEGEADLWRESEKKDKEKFAIIMTDFEEALKVVQPSSKREGLSEIPNVKWEDVGDLDPLRKELDYWIDRRIKHPDSYEKFGIKSETSFLLYGPPGCGKTLIAKAVANEAGARLW